MKNYASSYIPLPKCAYLLRLGSSLNYSYIYIRIFKVDFDYRYKDRMSIVHSSIHINTVFRSLIIWLFQICTILLGSFKLVKVLIVILSSPTFLSAAAFLSSPQIFKKMYPHDSRGRSYRFLRSCTLPGRDKFPRGNRHVRRTLL